jgi:RHS repeat-associated protein
MKTWMNAVVALSLLLSSIGLHQPVLAYAPASPETSAGQETTPSEVPESTVTPTATVDYGGYPPPFTPSPEPTQTPVAPSPTPDSGDSGLLPTPIPEDTNENASPGISAIANPAIYVPGKPVFIFWNLSGRSLITEGSNEQIRVRFSAPPVSDSDGTQPDERELIFPVGDSQGVIPWEIDEHAVFPLYATLDYLIDGILIDTEVIEIGQADFEVGSQDGGISEGLGGKVRIEVPIDALEEDAFFSVRYPGPNKLPSISLSGNPLEIIAVGKESGQNITKFRQPIQIQIQYNREDIFQWSEDDLVVFYYNEKTLDWYPLPTTVDRENQRLIAYSDHLTVFDFKAESWQANSLPTVDSFKVSDFTGAATYAYSFWTPPGQAGLSPNLSLSYNSQVMDEASAYSQASWVGMGWSLDTGAISRNMHGTNDNTNDDTFAISANGISGLLLPVNVNGSVTTYNTADQSFLKVQFNSTTNVWSAWAKDGTLYTFNQPVKTSKTIGCATANQLNITWRWSLGSVTDTNGNSITYTYSKETKTGCSNEIAVYPDTITYPHNRYRVRFVREARSDYQDSWTITTARSLYSTQRLKEIRVEHDPGGSWSAPTLVRKYAFGYAADTATTNVIYPRFHWSHGGHTLTLISVQEISGDGSLSLPATTFYYGDEDGDGVDDFMHLTKVDNGLGGQVQMQYARWSYFDDFNDDLRSLQTEYGATNQECGPIPGVPDEYYSTQWSAVLGYPFVRCDASSHKLQIGNDNVNGQPSVLGVGHRSIPEHVVKPGSLYRFFIQARAQDNQADINWGFVDTSTNTESMLYSDNTKPSVGTTLVNLEGTLEMPASFDPSNTKLRLEADGCLISQLQFMLFPLYYRVTSRTITESATEQSQTYTYQYDNPSSNTEYTSAAVNASGSSCSSLYTCAMREYRGHAMTKVTDPSGLTGITWYYQSDTLKGKPYHTMTVRQDFADDFEQPLSQNSDWTATGAVSGQATLFNVDFDGALKAENGQSNWDVGITHTDYSLSDGDVALAQFRLSAAAAQGEVGIETAGGKFFGVLVRPNNGQPEALLRYNTGSGLQTGTVLIDSDHFQLDRWYVIKLSLDDDDGFKLRLWQLDDPTVHGEGSLGGFAAANWRFRERVNSGVIWLDEYAEGVLYDETETAYATLTQYDTISSNSIPNLASSTLMTYKDLGVVWTYTTETISAAYASDAVLNVGDTKWMGTRTTYQYEAEDQNNGQYGNLTRSIISVWDGADWVEERASKTEFWPRNDSSLYLVSLPARVLQLDCAGGCDFSGSTGLLGETLYLYDSNSAYNSPPTLAAPYNKAGRLRAQRTLIDLEGGQKRYGEVGYAYDSYGNILTQSIYPGYASAGASPTGDVFTTTFVYDTVYHTYALSQTNPLNQTFSSAYDYALGLPTGETDPNGAATTATYDVLGRITAVIRPGDDSNNPTLRFSYNIDGGNHLFWTEAQQRLSGSVYSKVRKYYNGLGQLLQTQADAEVNGTLKTVVSDIYYDDMGRADRQAMPYSVTLSNGAFTAQPSNPANYTQTVYDALGRVYQVIAPDGSTQTSEYSIQTDNTVPYSVTTSTNPRGNTTLTWSDALGRAYKVVPPGGPGVTYTYDAADRLTSAQYGSYTTTLTYDVGGRKLSMDDPDMGYWTYKYDALGNLTRQTDARGCLTSLEYDKLNRLLEKSFSNAVGGSCAAIAAGSESVYYSYDQGTNGIGRRSGMEDASGSTLWGYDLRGRLTAETVEISGVGAYSSAWAYNSADLPTETTYPNGETLFTGYNAQGAVTALDSENWVSYAGQAKYDEAGRLLEWTLGNGVKTGNTYYAWDTQGGRLQSSSSETLSNTWQELVYSYDANGNISAVQDAIAGETLNYSYDALERLTGVSGAYGQSYGYNAASGNLESKAGQTLVYGDAEHPHAATGLGGNAYAYDANGNMTSRQIASGTYTLNYDAEGRLVGISGAGMSAAYTYNGDGERVKVQITTGSDTTTSAYIGDYFEVSVGDPIPPQTPTPPDCSTSSCVFIPLLLSASQAIPDGQAWTSYYYVNGRRLAMRVQSNEDGVEDGVYYLLADHLGGTTITLDVEANKVAELRYSAWGETRYTGGDTPTQRRYTGQIEAEAGLYFYQARWYDPALGRFAQADTIVPNPASSKAWDRYAYAFNNPILFFDPSGHASTSACIDGVYCGTPVTKPIDSINYWKGVIKSNYGVIMSDDEGRWDVKNLVRIYIGLTYMDKNFLQGQTNRLVSGATFLFTRSENGYGGQTFKGNDNPLLGGQIAFYTHSVIPYQNLYHEFAHLLDNRLGDRITEKLGASAVYYEGEYLFGGKGIGNIDLSTIMKFKLPDSYVSTGVDAFQHPSSDPIEQWADMWANYVSGNLKMNEAGGILVKSWITTNINPILEVRGAR